MKGVLAGARLGAVLILGVLLTGCASSLIPRRYRIRKSTALLLIFLLVFIGFQNLALAQTFTKGDIVEVYNTGGIGLKVRDTPCGQQIGNKPDGSIGLILEGPRYCVLNGTGYYWWRIRWSDGLEGWSAQNWLRRLSLPSITSSSPSPSTVSPGGTVTLIYNVTNPGKGISGSIAPLLGASIQPSGGGNYLSDPANDRKASIPSGSSSVSRPFVVPTAATPGTYDLLVSLVVDVNNNGRIDSDDRVWDLKRFPGALQVRVTCTYSIFPTSQPFGPSGGSGSVSVTAPSGCSWTATSNASWITIISGSSGSGNGTVNYSVASNPDTSSRTGTMTIAGQTFTVTQAAPTVTTRTLTVASLNPNSGVFITVSPNDNNGQGSGTTQFTRTYNNNTVVTLTAPSTAGGNTFQKWQRNGVDWATTTTTTVTMDANYTMTAVYVAPPPATFTLTVNKTGTGSGIVTGSGINCGSDCQETYISGTSVTLTATAASASTFAGWSGCDSVSGNQCTVTMNANRTVTATFNTSPPNTFTLTVSKAGTGSGTVTGPGIDCGSDCQETYTSGTSVTLSATPASGSTFAGWSGACSGTGSCTLIMDANKSVTATFNTISQNPILEVTPDSLNLGDVTVGQCSANQSFTVRNSGSGTLSGSATTSAPFSIVSGGSFNLGAGQSVQVSLRFCPTAAGQVTRQVNFTSNGGNTSRDVSGNGAPTPTFSISGRVTSGGSGLSGVTMTLSGAAQQTTTTDNNGNYSFAGLNNGNYTLTPSRSDCNFNPPNRSVSISGSNVSGQDFTASCAPPPGGNPVLAITPAYLDFENVAAGQCSEKSFTARNAGNGTLNATVATKAPFSITVGSSLALGTGESATVTVKFCPTDANPVSDKVTFTSNANNKDKLSWRPVYGNFFKLSFPLPNRNPDNAWTTSVFDHSMTNGRYCADQIIAAYTGDQGEKQVSQQCRTFDDLKKYANYPIIIWGVRRVQGQENSLSYEGHPGLDFRTRDQDEDLAAPGSIPVLAAVDGIVRFGGCGSSSGAMRIEVTFGQQIYQVCYLHLNLASFNQQTSFVQDGQKVERCQVIGIAGDTGSAGEPHLHFEVRSPSGSSLDPYGWLAEDRNDPYTTAINVPLWRDTTCPVEGAVPSAPTNLTVTATTRSSVRLRWNDNSNNELYFKLVRMTMEQGSAVRTPIFVRANQSDQATYSDSALRRGQRYCYQVRAYNTAGASSYSNTVCATPGQRGSTTLDQAGLFVNQIILLAQKPSVNGAIFTVEGQGVKSLQAGIFDLSGRKVFDSGEVQGNTLAWNLQNNAGQPLANGIYLYVVRVRGFNGEEYVSEVRKLIVLR